MERSLQRLVFMRIFFDSPRFNSRIVIYIFSALSFAILGMSGLFLVTFFMGSAVREVLITALPCKQSFAFQNREYFHALKFLLRFCDWIASRFL